MDEEAKALLREIRDHLAASSERYDRAIAENRRLNQEHFARMRRGALVSALVLGGFLALLCFLSR